MVQVPFMCKKEEVIKQRRTQYIGLSTRFGSCETRGSYHSMKWKGCLEKLILKSPIIW